MAKAEPPRRRDPAHPPTPPAAPLPANRFTALGASAARAAADFYRGLTAKRGPDPIERERLRQAQAHAGALSKYRTALYGLRARMVVGAGAAVTGAGVGLTVMDTELLAAGVAAGVAAFGGYSAVRSKVAINQLRPPPDPPVIMPASAPLPPAAPGAAAAARITVARSQIMELLPTVEYLQAEAAGQVLAADAAAAPATHAVVERIRAMHRIVAEMAGSPAAQAAALSLPVLEQRLAEGAAAYHELLAAVIGLASAPDLHGSIGQSLRPAINELQAYTAGLERAAQTWG